MIDPKTIQSTSTTIYRMLFALCAMLLVGAFIVDPPSSIVHGFVEILLSPSTLVTDYFALAGYGATMLNSGLILLVTLLVLRHSRALMSGPMTAACLMILGFSLFGKNVVNSMPITLGVLLYAKLHSVPPNRYVLIGLFGTGLSPLTSWIAFSAGMPIWLGLIVGFLAGVFIGLVLPPLSVVCLSFHQGFSLYNIGFAVGLIGMLALAIFRMFGLDVEQGNLFSAGSNGTIAPVLYVSLTVLLGCGLYFNAKDPKHNIIELCKESGRLMTDYVSMFGAGPTLINMSLTGMIATTLVLVLRGELNGPVVGGILSVIGFSAFGKNVRNILPVMTGLLLAAFISPIKPNETTTLVAILFGTTLSPIAGHFGVVAGVVAGFCQMALVSQVGYLHGGLNLYNNGFSSGFVAALLTPIFESIRQIRRKEGIL